MSEEKIDLEITINGKQVSRRGVPARQLLVDYLHDDPELRLTGTKLSCGIGQCGACKVALQESKDGPMMAVLGCYARLDSIDSMHVTTVEGLAQNGRLHPLQQAFLDEYAFQCGFCTPGFLMAGVVLMDELRREPISRHRLKQAILNSINSNLCRCTGYVRYYDAIEKVILNTPGLIVEGAPGPGAISPSGISFRVVKRSRNDLQDKTLIGFFEEPSGEAVFAGRLSLDSCRAWLSATTSSIRTGERVRDLNLRESFFRGRREIRFDLESAEAIDPRLALGAVPNDTPVPITVRGSLTLGRANISIETELLVRVVEGDRLSITSRLPLKLDPRDLGLRLTSFAQDFNLVKLSPLVEVSVDAQIPYRIA
jgi:aerobic-type carbon monoxide dehydrogenase small subunit (CoxS/CutS family)